MSNIIHVRGVVTHITLRDISLFMTIKEDGRYGSTQTVKAYCPNDLKATPDVWTSNFRHLERGLTVLVEGRLSYDKETELDPSSGQYVPVRHPKGDRDLVAPYVWAFKIDVLFDPALHMKRQDHRSAPMPHPANSPAPAPTRTPSASQDEDGLPPLPWAESAPPVAWNAN